MALQTLDLELAARDRLYKPSAKKVEVVDAPAMSLLMVDSAGAPNSSGDLFPLI